MGSEGPHCGQGCLHGDVPLVPVRKDGSWGRVAMERLDGCGMECLSWLVIADLDATFLWTFNNQFRTGTDTENPTV